MALVNSVRNAIRWEGVALSLTQQTEQPRDTNDSGAAGELRRHSALPFEHVSCSLPGGTPSQGIFWCPTLKATLPFLERRRRNVIARTYVCVYIVLHSLRPFHGCFC